MDFVADDFAVIAKRLKEIRDELDAALKKPSESDPTTPAAQSQPPSDDTVWDYGFY